VFRYQTLTEALEAAPGDREFVTHWVDEDERETLTFADFRRRARAQALRFREHGLNADDRIALVMPQTIAAMTSFAGAMMLGAVPSFLAYPNFKVEPSKYRSGLAGVTANLGAKLVVIDEDFPADLLEHIAVGGEMKTLRATEDSESREDLKPPHRSMDDLAFIQHSAGTTGLQKGVALGHGAVLRQIEHLAAALKIDNSSDRIYSWLPLYHDMGLIACFILPMVCHVPIVMQSPLEWVMQPETMLQIVTDCRCTLAWMPNFAFQFVPRRTPARRWADYDLSSLRALINCSEPVRASSMQEFANAFASIGLTKGVLQSSYAMAENVFAVTQSEASPTQVWADGRVFRSEQRVQPVSENAVGSVSFLSSGKLLQGSEVRIVGEGGEEVASGKVGEILVRSDSLFGGYYNRPDLTSEAIVAGWYHTGDLGFLLDDELYVVGRKKDLLIVGGENIYPQDIEAIVDAHPAIREGRSIALGIFDRNLGTEAIVVVAEVESEALLDDSAAREQEIRNLIVASTGIAVSTILLKPPKWIVKSTAGKAARSATREKLLREHPALEGDREGSMNV
jgi:fatty-acyl-CoA synthase